MGMKLTFIEAASKRLCKTFTPTGSRAYPNVRNVSSHTTEDELTLDGFKNRFKKITEHAALGHAMMKGSFTRELVDESRAGMTDKGAKTSTIVLDIDGFALDKLEGPHAKFSELPATALTQKVVRQYAELVVFMLPDTFQEATYIAHASSSFGRKKHELSLHLEFMLSEPISPLSLKPYLTNSNFTQPLIENQLTLAGSGMALSWTLDPCLADNSRIVYIAPPIFNGVADPFDDSAERWVFVEKPQLTVDIASAAGKIKLAAVKKATRDKVDGLRKNEGLPKYAPKTRMLLDGDRKIPVVSNPDEMMMEFVRASDTFAYFNLNGKANEAYYVRLDSPEIMHNFKSEDPFEFARANRPVYEQFMAEFGNEVRAKQKLVPMIVIDYHTDQHYKVVYDQEADRIAIDGEGRHRIAVVNSGNAEAFMEDMGQPLPDPIPQWDVLFMPHTSKVVDHDAKLLNTYSMPTCLREPKPIMPEFRGATYEMGGENKKFPAMIKLLSPTIYKIIWHMAGSDQEGFCHFINWLAWCVQNRRVSSTAWIFSGTQGTGKMLFSSKILSPLVGASYVRPIRLSTLQDQFNAMLEGTLFMAVDEFRLADDKNSIKTMDYIKELIGNESGQVRAMRADSRTAKFWMNWIFFSNHADVLDIPDGDRRFNIAVPQKVKINQAYPEIFNDQGSGEALNTLIANELPIFASFIMHFDANGMAARTCLENKAKGNMKVASLNTAQQFCFAARMGSLDYFIENIMVETKGMADTPTVARIQAARRLVQNWMKQLGQVQKVPVDDLAIVWQALNPDSNQPVQKFRTMLIRNDVTVDRTLVDGRPTSVVEIRWVVTDADLEAMAKAKLVDNDTALIFQGIAMAKKDSKELH